MPGLPRGESRTDAPARQGCPDRRQWRRARLFALLASPGYTMNASDGRGAFRVDGRAPIASAGSATRSEGAD